MSKKIKITCLIWSFLFCTLAYANQSYSTYKDRKHDFTIQYPSTWIAKKYYSGIVVADIESDDGNSGLQVRITQAKANIDAFIDAYIEKFEKDMSATELSGYSIEANGKTGYAVLFRANRGGKDYFLKSYIIPDHEHDRLYIFQSGAPFEQRYQVEPILDAIAESIGE